MINTKLIKMMDDSKQHVVKTVVWQWIALVMNIIFIFNIAYYIDKVRLREITTMNTILLRSEERRVGKEC